MAEKSKSTTPFNSGQQTNAKGKSEKVEVKSNMSKVRNAGQPDPLAQAISGKEGYVPSGMHIFVRPAFHPAGAHYNPFGEFGEPTGNMKSKATNPMGGSGGKGTFRGKP